MLDTQSDVPEAAMDPGAQPTLTRSVIRPDSGSIRSTVPCGSPPSAIHGAPSATVIQSGPSGVDGSGTRRTK